MTLSEFLKNKRRKLNLTQQQLAGEAGVGLRFIRDSEQGKTTLRMDIVNQVLKLFGQELGPQPINREKALCKTPALMWSFYSGVMWSDCPAYSDLNHFFIGKGINSGV